MVNQQNIIADIAKAQYAALLGEPQYANNAAQAWADANSFANDSENNAAPIAAATAAALAVLQAEVLGDPTGQGYIGQTPVQVADLVNAPWVSSSSEKVTYTLANAVALDLAGYQDTAPYLVAPNGAVTCGDPQIQAAIQAIVATAQKNLTRTVVTQAENPPRILAISAGVPYFDNVATDADITAALALQPANQVTA